VQPQAQLLAVLEEDLGEGDGRLLAAQLDGGLLAQGGQDGLDVLAGAQGVGAEVGALAGVVADVEAADRNPVLPPRLGVADLVVAEDAVAAQVLDLEPLLGRPLPADVDRFLAQHSSPPEGRGGSPRSTRITRKKRRKCLLLTSLFCPVSCDSC